MHPAVFLDRDGVIIENRSSYVRSWEDVKILPGALEALARLAAAPYLIIMVTNQSAIGRGLISLEQAWAINNRLVEHIRCTGGRIDAVFMCPHAPQEQCACRKPKPGLLLQAAEIHKIDLDRSVLIGDALSDLLAGQAAGLGQTILVRTGRGALQEQLPQPVELKPFKVCNTLAEALEELLRPPLSP
jgi:D-glycero-D-manno-heptose 1,7-bisphosphate phosphatase